MARYSRILSTAAATAAEPPEVVNVESDFVVILAALLCALICVVGLIAVARCAWLRRATGDGAVGAPSTAIANKGVKKKNLQLLPKFTYSAGGGGGEGGAATTTKFASTECAICLGEFVEGEEVRVLPQCGHGFHVGCIDAWLGSHSSCPSCRKLLVMARCQKCGQFPAATTSSATCGGDGAATTSSATCGGDGAATEMELNTGEGNHTNADNSNQAHSAFLP